MKKSMLKTKILIGVLATGIIASSATIAFALGNSENNTEPKAKSKKEFRIGKDKKENMLQKQEAMKKNLEEILKQGVSSNIITQDESNKVLEYINNRQAKVKDGEKNKDHRGKVRVNLFSELVNEGILTKEKAQALSEKLFEKRIEEKQQILTEGLNKLVSDRTINQEQADKILEAIKSELEARKADFEKVKNMTEEERKQYFQSRKEQHKDPLKALVENKIINDEQAKAVRNIMPHREKNGKGFMKKQFRNKEGATKIE